MCYNIFIINRISNVGDFLVFEQIISVPQTEHAVSLFGSFDEYIKLLNTNWFKI